MPWKVSGVVEQRARFVLDHASGLYSVSELCARYGISRQSGYKWIERYRAEGITGLEDQSRAPLTSPQRMCAAMEAKLLEIRQVRPTWGPRKILAFLRNQGVESLPAASSVGDLFQRHGLVRSRRRREPRSHEIAGRLEAAAANDVWSADFKGEFRLASGPYCFPFTLSDAYSRFLLSCQGEPSTSLEGAQRALVRAFREDGLPKAIRTDNGTPFVGHGLSGLSQLNVWWIKLGIAHQRIARGRPDQNGRHERMHRTLKAEATRPPAATFAEQQRRFDDFGRVFNQERPHESLGNRTPASIYETSVRTYPERIAKPEYPAHFERRTVDRSGHFKFRGFTWFLAHPMSGETLGLVEVDEDIWAIVFYSCELGRLNPSTGTLVLKVSTMSPV